MVLRLIVSVLALLALSSCARPEPQGPVVLAASSLQEALDAVADRWAEQGHPRPALSFAGTPALARQAQAGAPADIILLADNQWMDILQAKGFLVAGTRRDLLGNRLVLITPKSTAATIAADSPVAALLALGEGRLAMADPDSVPAGRYGREALESLGLWDGVKDRIVPAENVRAALALVERGEAPLGLVYASDLAASSKVRLAAPIPDAAQPEIRYPVAMVSGSQHAEAQNFLAFLASPEASAIFAQYQFFPLAAP